MFLVSISDCLLSWKQRTKASTASLMFIHIPVGAISANCKPPVAQGHPGRPELPEHHSQPGAGPRLLSTCPNHAQQTITVIRAQFDCVGEATAARLAGVLWTLVCHIPCPNATGQITMTDWKQQQHMCSLMQKCIGSSSALVKL